MSRRVLSRGKWLRTALSAGIAMSALSGITAFAQAPTCNGKNVYPCSVGGTLLVINKPTGTYNFGGGGSGGGGGGAAVINDPLNPGFALTTAIPLQAFGPVLPSITNYTINLATVSSQPTITGLSASVACGVSGAATYSFTLSTPDGPLVLNCPHMAAPGTTVMVTGQVSFPPLSSLAVALTLAGTAPSPSDILTVSSFSAQVQMSSSGCTYTVSPGGQAFSPAGGSGNVNITAGTGCGWSVSNIPSWVTITSAASGTGNGTVSYQVASDQIADRTASMTVANVAFNLEQEAAAIPGLNFIGSMPHLAVAGGWNTTVTLVNKVPVSTLVRPNLLADDGTPLTLPLTFPLQPPTGPLLGASVDRTLAANASLILQASGPAAETVQTGSAQLSATGPPGTSMDGFAIFHFDPTSQEAVVPLETRNAPSYVLAFDNTNSVLLGVALENLSLQAANIPVILRDDTGARIDNGMASISLPAGGHTSFVLSDQFTVTAGIRGTVEFDTPLGGRIGALGIRFTPPGTLTTIPALANVTTGGLAAHIASGGGWETTFVLVNLSSTTQQAVLTFLDNNGKPLLLPLTSPENNGSLQAAASLAAPVLAPGASQWIQSAGSSTSPLLTGSAQLSSTGNVGGFVIFRYDLNGQEAVAPIESRNAPSYVLAFDNTGGITTGVAISVVSPVPVLVNVVLRNAAGTQIGQPGVIPLAPNGHSSFGLASQFPMTANIRGTAEFQAPPGVPISVLGIRSPPTLTFTTLPPLAK